jgi:hypothetical protein
MRTFLKQILVVFLAILVTLSLMDIFYTWAVTQKPLHDIRENEHIDYLIIGDSRSNPLVTFYLEHLTGSKVMNFAEPGFVLEDNLTILDYFFRKGNTVDRVLIQADWKFGSRTEVDKNWAYTPYLIREKGLLSPRIPFWIYAENNRNFKPMFLVKQIKDGNTKRTTSQLADTSDINAANVPFRYNEKLKADYSKYPFRINDIKALESRLKAKGVKEVILFSIPHLPEWITTQSDSASYKHIIRKSGFKYYDFSTIYADTTWFKDYLHVRNSRYMDFCRRFSATVMTGHLQDRQPLK